MGDARIAQLPPRAAPADTVGTAALMVAQTLRDVVGVRCVDELRFLFFRKLVEDDGVGYLSASP